MKIHRAIGKKIKENLPSCYFTYLYSATNLGALGNASDISPCAISNGAELSLHLLLWMKERRQSKNVHCAMTTCSRFAHSAIGDNCFVANQQAADGAVGAVGN
jgi:hypothetical protein